jgi:hypothetical protein
LYGVTTDVIRDNELLYGVTVNVRRDNKLLYLVTGYVIRDNKLLYLVTGYVIRDKITNFCTEQCYEACQTLVLSRGCYGTS